MDPSRHVGDDDHTVTIGPGELAARILSLDTVVHGLVVLAPDEPPKRIALPSGPFSIGRMEPNSLVLDQAGVSRRHCMLEVIGDHARICDLGSTNGTFIDGVKVTEPKLLSDGAKLRVGPFTLRYERKRRDDMDEARGLDEELSQARGYVDALLPKPIEDGPVRAAWVFRPCATLGGDAFGYQMLSPDCFMVYILDVSGHGAGAAMHSVSAMNVLRQRAIPGVDFRDPAAVLRGLNAMFEMESHHGLFFTIWYGVYDIPTRKLCYAAAGHHPAFLFAETLAVPKPLVTRHVPVGTWQGHGYTSSSVVLPKGARLFLFSDGAFEVQTLGGAVWNLAALVQALGEQEVPGVSEPERLYRRVRAIARPGPLEDDFSALMLTFP